MTDLIELRPPRAVRVSFFLASILPWLLAPGVRGAEPPARPNVVIIFADDKYEPAEPRAQKRRKNREKWPFSAGFEIAENCGKFRGIPGN